MRESNHYFVFYLPGEFSVRPSWDLASQDNPECHGITMGLVGKLRPHKSVL